MHHPLLNSVPPSHHVYHCPNFNVPIEIQLQHLHHFGIKTIFAPIGKSNFYEDASQTILRQFNFDFDFKYESTSSCKPIVSKAIVSNHISVNINDKDALEKFNFIKERPEAIVSLQTTVDINMLQFKNLQELSLNLKRCDNKIPRFSEFKFLRKLTLCNEITWLEFESIITQCPQLHYLSVDNNEKQVPSNVHKVNEQLAKLTQLHTLSLFAKLIPVSMMQVILCNMDSLRTFIISDLNNMDYTLIQSTSQIDTLRISGECDYSLVPILFPNLTFISVFKPQNLAGIKFNNIKSLFISALDDLDVNVIMNSFPNLIEIEIYQIFDHVNDFFQLSKLSTLKKLSFPIDGYFDRDFCEKFAQLFTSLEFLHLEKDDSFRALFADDIDPQMFEPLANMSSLTTLIISCKSCRPVIPFLTNSKCKVIIDEGEWTREEDCEKMKKLKFQHAQYVQCKGYEVFWTQNLVNNALNMKISSFKWPRAKMTDISILCAKKQK